VPEDSFVLGPSNARQPPLARLKNVGELSGPRVQGNRVRPDFDTTRAQGTALAEQLQPVGAVRELFRDATDLSVVASTPAPVGRFEDGNAKWDFIFQQTTIELISRGVINEHSFVLMDTGHAIPQADELLRASGLRAQGSFVLPPIEEVINGRIAAQAQTWGDRIQQLQRENADKSPGALFLGLDVHRRQPLSPGRWPTAEQLKARGITNVPVLLEATPSKVPGLENTSPDVRAYVESLQRAGLRVTFHDVDGRY
jgi:hypothetical protein